MATHRLCAPYQNYILYPLWRLQFSEKSVQRFQRSHQFIIPMLNTLLCRQQPTLLLTSRMGALYNLTPSNQHNIEAVQLSVGDFMHMKDVLSQLPQHLSFKKFLGYSEDVLTCLTPHDHYKEKCMQGCGEEDQIEVFSNKGYIKLSSKEYLDYVYLMKPDLWMGFTETPLLIRKVQSMSNKSVKRAIKKSVKFLESIKDLEKVGLLLAPLHGGTTEYLSHSITEVLKYESIIDGFVLCDIPEESTNEDIQKIISTVREHTKDKKQFLLCLAGNGHIDRLSLFKEGIHLFEINYPFQLAEKNLALKRLP